VSFQSIILQQHRYRLFDGYMSHYDSIMSEAANYARNGNPFMAGFVSGSADTDVAIDTASIALGAYGAGTRLMPALNNTLNYTGRITRANIFGRGYVLAPTFGEMAFVGEGTASMAANVVESWGGRNIKPASNAPYKLFTPYAQGNKANLAYSGVNVVKSGKINLNVVLKDASRIRIKSKNPSQNLTEAGFQYSKHASRHPRWGEIKSNNIEKNKVAAENIKDIMDVNGDFNVVANESGIKFLEKFHPDGRGIRLQMDGSFKGFLDKLSPSPYPNPKY